MSVVAFIRQLMALGLSLDDALKAAEVHEQATATAPQRTARQERNKRYYDRKASENRLKASEQDVSDDCSPPPSFPPKPPKPPTPAHRDITTHARKAARRCPKDWEPTLEDRQAGMTLGLTDGEIAAELEKFRDHTFGTARIDWSATFRNWLREANRRKPKPRPANDRTPSNLDERLARSFAASQRPIDFGDFD